MHPFRVEKANDPTGLWARPAEHMHLDHLSEVLDCMCSLSHHKEVEEGKPGMLLVDCSHGRENERHPGCDDQKAQKPESPPCHPESENEQRGEQASYHQQIEKDGSDIKELPGQ